VKVLVAVGALASLAAGCAPDTSPGGLAPELRPIAEGIAQGQHAVSPQALSEWIVAGREDFALVDLRDAAAYEEAHIEGAQNLPVTDLVEPQVVKGLPDDRKVILYSGGTAAAAQASVLLRLAGLDARALEGGYDAWHDRVLNPDLAAAEEGEREKLRAIACRFRNVAYEPMPPEADGQMAASAQDQGARMPLLPLPGDDAPAAQADSGSKLPLLPLPGEEEPPPPAQKASGYQPPLLPLPGQGGAPAGGGLIIDEGC
jgi:rhodanese-related sulfurtransferase